MVWQRALGSARNRELLQHVWPRIARGELRIVIDKTFPMQDAAAAHEYMDSGAHIGKILLTMEG